MKVPAPYSASDAISMGSWGTLLQLVRAGEVRVHHSVVAVTCVYLDKIGQFFSKTLCLARLPFTWTWTKERGCVRAVFEFASIGISSFSSTKSGD